MLFIVLMSAIVCAALLQLVFGLKRPVLWGAADRASIWFEKKLTKLKRSRQDLMFRGFITVVCLYVLLMAGLYTIFTLARPLSFVFPHHIIFSVLSGVLLTTTLLPFATLQKTSPAEFWQIQMPKAEKDILSKNYALIAAVASQLHMFISPLLIAFFLGVEATLFYTILAAFTLQSGKYGYHNGFATLPLWVMRAVFLLGQMGQLILFILAAAVTPGLSIRTLLKSLAERKFKAMPIMLGGASPFLLAAAAKTILGGPVKGGDKQHYKFAWLEGIDAKRTNIDAAWRAWRLADIGIRFLTLLIFLYLSLL